MPNNMSLASPYAVEEAQAFIDALAGPAAAVTFQTFYEQGSGGDHLRRVLHGSLAEHIDLLGRLNSQGAGVFLMVNAGDLKGRKKENVVSVRALFLDLDGAPLSAVEQSGLAPDIIVESSPGRWHVYWCVADCPTEQFKPLQKELARRFGGDAMVCDLPRVMRVPGFLHQKSAKPFHVRLVKATDRPERRIQDLLDSLGINSGQKDRSERKSFSGLLCPSVYSSLPQRFGERNEKLFAYARRMRSEFPDASLGQRRHMVQVWYQQAAPHVRTKDIGVFYADFERAWARIKSPHGLVLEEVLSDLQDPPSDLVALGYGEHGKRLLAVMYALHRHQERHHGGSPIIMGARKAAEILGIDKTDANKLLRSFSHNGVLELVERGSGNRASRWRWVWLSDDGVRRENFSDDHKSAETYYSEA